MIGVLAVLVNIFSLLAIASPEQPVALWGTWMGPCEKDPMTGYHRRMYYTFDSEDGCYEHPYYYELANCKGTVHPAPARSGSYTIGASQGSNGDVTTPIDMIFGPQDDKEMDRAENFYQIYSVKSDNLRFGKTWSNSSASRPTELELSKVWQKVSPY